MYSHIIHVDFSTGILKVADICITIGIALLIIQSFNRENEHNESLSPYAFWLRGGVMPAWFGGSTLNPDELIPRDQQWKLQWSRVMRWHQRTLDIAKKSVYAEPSAYDLDTVIAFLQNCYHLRDWIQACRPDLNGKLADLFSQSFEMQGCRDVCNAFKHKSYKTPSLDADFNLYREYDSFAAEAHPSLSAVNYRTAFRDGNDIRKYDLFEFAESCYRIWDSFLAQELA